MDHRVACWLAIFISASGFAGAQTTGDGEHISWRFSSLKQSESEWKLLFTAVIEPGWHLYSQSTPAGGPMPVSFDFAKGDGFRLSGDVKEAGSLKRSYDPVFMIDVLWYESNVVFTQVVRMTRKGNGGKVTGEINYSVCSGEMCMPGSIGFSLGVGN